MSKVRPWRPDPLILARRWAIQAETQHGARDQDEHRQDRDEQESAQRSRSAPYLMRKRQLVGSDGLNADDREPAEVRHGDLALDLFEEAGDRRGTVRP